MKYLRRILNDKLYNKQIAVDCSGYFLTIQGGFCGFISISFRLPRLPSFYMTTQILN